MRSYVALLVGLAACSNPEVDAGDERTVAPLESHLIEAIAQAADEYQGWGVVGPYVNWAPFLCSAPPATTVQHSRASGTAEHANKLYALYSNQAKRYVQIAEEDSGGVPVGTVLVKEAYVPVACASEEAPGWGEAVAQPMAGRGGFVPFVEKDGQMFRTGERLDLFVMVLLEKGTAGTMDGWAFGTVTPGGEVTSAGAVASCVGCHAKAPHAGLFGMPQP